MGNRLDFSPVGNLGEEGWTRKAQITKYPQKTLISPLK